MGIAGPAIAAQAPCGVAIRSRARTLRDWKEDPSDDPMLELWDVEIDEQTTLRYVTHDPDGKGAIDYLGNEYVPVTIKREPIKEGLEGDLFSLNLLISNISGLVGGYIETNDLEGNDVTVTHVPYSIRNVARPSEKAVTTFTVQDQGYDRKVARIKLGHADFMRRRLPWRRAERFRCQFPYNKRFERLNPCFYPSDRFEADTRQGLHVGAFDNSERLRLFGWRTINALNALEWDVDTTILGNLHVATSSASDFRWFGSARNGPFVYKVLSGDVDVWTELTGATFRPGMIVGLLIQSAEAGSEGDWLLYGRQFSVAHGVVSHATVADNTAVVAFGLSQNYRFLRLERVGATINLYYSTKEDADWELFNAETVPLTAQVRVGLCLSADTSSSAAINASFGQFRFRAGGLPTCDFTIDGSNGCRIHNNEHHFGGMPGIPRV